MSQIIVEDHEGIKLPATQGLYQEVVANIAKAVMATVTEEVGGIIMALEETIVRLVKQKKGGAK